VELFVECASPLFISVLEVVHSRCDTLQFRVFIQVLEVHDYTIEEESDDDPSDSSGNSDCDGNPRPLTGSSLRPWPRIYRVVGDRVLPYDDLWPSLPNHGGGVAWCISLPMEAYVDCTPKKPAKSYGA
jgi:hypothetical protein